VRLEQLLSLTTAGTCAPVLSIVEKRIEELAANFKRKQSIEGARKVLAERADFPELLAWYEHLFKSLKEFAREERHAET